MATRVALSNNQFSERKNFPVPLAKPEPIQKRCGVQNFSSIRANALNFVALVHTTSNSVPKLYIHAYFGHFLSSPERNSFGHIQTTPAVV